MRKVKKIGKKPVQRSEPEALEKESSESEVDEETLDYLRYLGGVPGPVTATPPTESVLKKYKIGPYAENDAIDEKAAELEDDAEKEEN